MKNISRRNIFKLGCSTALASAGIAMLGGCSDNNTNNKTKSNNTNNHQSDDNARAIYDWLGKEPNVKESNVIETVDVDVVILGGGHAGTQCAKSAAEYGASVAI